MSPEENAKALLARLEELGARLEMLRGEVVLRDLGSLDGSQVNGEPVRDAILRPGDQVVFDAHHRFVLEAPSGAPGERVATPPPEEAGETARRGNGAMRLPWLLLAALVLAGLLALLLLFGAG